MELAEVAYTAYCDHTGGVSLISGATLPGWHDLKPEIQAAWQAATLSVLATQAEPQPEGTLFRRPSSSYMTGRRLYQILSRYVELPSTDRLVIEAEMKGFVTITTQCLVSVDRAKPQTQR